MAHLYKRFLAYVEIGLLRKCTKVLNFDMVCECNQVIAFVCACIAVQMLILSLLTKYWLEAEGFCQGLWEYCFVSVGNDMCSSNLDKGMVFQLVTLIDRCVE